MKKIKVGGVPEHFNYPWHYGIAHDIFKEKNIDLEWIDVKGGSGAMCNMLDNDDLDIALVLTEGIVKHIQKGSSSRIIQQYVKSPLIWGVHSAKGTNLSADDLSEAAFARSRPGSGSHLMSYVHAQQKGYQISEENFVTVGNIDGAMTAFSQKKCDILLWEKFMTQPYVDSGKCDRIGYCVSPWPCFMMVGSGSFIKSNETQTVLDLGEAIIESVNRVVGDPLTKKHISEKFNLELTQVEEWYSSVEWQTSPWVSKKMLQNVHSTLRRIGILEEELTSIQGLCHMDTKLY